VRYYFAFLAVLLIVGGAWLWLRRWRVASGGLNAAGRVVGFEERRDGDGSSWLPVVEFTDRRGVRHRFTAVAGGSERGPPEGSTVTVRYLPEAPEQAFILSWFHMWAAPAALFALGIVAWLAYLRG